MIAGNHYSKPLREVIEWAVNCNGDGPRKSIDELVAAVRSALEAEDELLWRIDGLVRQEIAEAREAERDKVIEEFRRPLLYTEIVPPTEEDHVWVRKNLIEPEDG